MADNQVIISKNLYIVVFYILFLISIFFASYHYIYIKMSFYDDVFIYLHMAQNSIEFGTWQYFPLIDRDALLASSPIKLVMLSLSAKIMSLFGTGERNLEDAKLVILTSGILTWVIFTPFWRKYLSFYALIGSIYMLSATILSATFDFEGGLMFLWLLTLVKMFKSSDGYEFSLPIILPAGLLIRPDFSFLIYVGILIIAITDPLVRNRLLNMRMSCLLIIPILWVTAAQIMSVFPIPVTYWGKASMPFMFEKFSFLEKVFERVGIVLGPSNPFSAKTGAIVGTSIVVLSLILSLSKLRNSAIVGTLVVLISIILFSRMPANYWWYYENLVLIILALLISNVIFVNNKNKSHHILCVAGISFILIYGIFNKSLRDQNNIWSFTLNSNNEVVGREDYGRSKGYLHLAKYANGDGTYSLPGVGNVLIKNPEIGITSYFTGRGGWIWDSAGLAQPLDIPSVQLNILKYTYPSQLRRSAEYDAKKISHDINRPIQVVEVWAMEDRNFEAASKACKFVIKEAALCINPYRPIN